MDGQGDVNTLDLAAIVSGVVGIAGAIFTFVTARRTSTDHRLDSFLDQLGKDNEQLRTRMDASEADRAGLHRELLRLRSALAEQSQELYMIRARESDLRAWARDVMAWCALAVGVIHGLNGTIPDPPPIPRAYSPDLPEENP